MITTEEELRALQQQLADILNAPPGSYTPIDAGLIKMVRAGFSDLANPRPKLIILGVVEVEEFRAMKRGDLAFAKLQPQQAVLQKGKHLMPVYGIEHDDR